MWPGVRSRAGRILMDRELKVDDALETDTRNVGVVEEDISSDGECDEEQRGAKQ